MDRIQSTFTGSPWNDCNFRGKFVVVAAVSFVLLGSLCGLYEIYNSTQKSEGVTTILNGTGGPDYTVLGGQFVSPLRNYYCDDRQWKLSAGSSSTTMYYGSSTSLGSSFQFDFRPTGKLYGNVIFSRPELWEFVVGDNSYNHISLKNLRSRDGMNLFKVNATTSDIGARIKIKNAISTSTLNTVRFEEEIDRLGLMSLTVYLNNEKFISDSMSVIDYPYAENANFSVSLIDYKKGDNHTGVYFPELKICP